MFKLVFEPGLLAGKRILVTGGGTGLGAALAAAYAQLGASVYIASRRGAVLEEAARRMAEETGSRVQGCVCDVRDPAAVDALLEHIWADGGPLTGLVNSAAGNFIAPTEQLSDRAFNTITDIQFRGAFYVTQGCGKRWIAGRDRGTVVSIVASDVRGGGPFHVPAIMAKAGVELMTRSLAVEWGGHGIRLNAIAPGVFRTEGSATRLDPLTAHGWSASDNPMKRIGELSEIANLGVFLMADGIDFLSGETIAIDGAGHRASGGTFSGLTALEPAQWAEIRATSKAATDAHKPLRG
jgi:NAD(P)-dependent dehydrogenase (short-subunit alcohol dehydrogenase family)